MRAPPSVYFPRRCTCPSPRLTLWWALDGRGSDRQALHPPLINPTASRARGTAAPATIVPDLHLHPPTLAAVEVVVAAVPLVLVPAEGTAKGVEPPRSHVLCMCLVARIELNLWTAMSCLHWKTGTQCAQCPVPDGIPPRVKYPTPPDAQGVQGLQ